MKQTELKRSAFKRKLPVVEPKVKKKRCASIACREWFIQERHSQNVCSVECSLNWVQEQKDKQARIQSKKERQARKAKLEEYKPLSYWLTRAERACNAYIRARDQDICISCGVMHSEAWQAGHFISKGANSTLRYNSDNIHKQCIKCNMHLASNAVEYRKGLVEKIGIERVEALEAWHPPVKMTREYAQSVEAEYKLKLKELKEKS